MISVRSHQTTGDDARWMTVICSPKRTHRGETVWDACHAKECGHIEDKCEWWLAVRCGGLEGHLGALRGRDKEHLKGLYWHGGDQVGLEQLDKGVPRAGTWCGTLQPWWDSEFKTSTTSGRRSNLTSLTWSSHCTGVT